MKGTHVTPGDAASDKLTLVRSNWSRSPPFPLPLLVVACQVTMASPASAHTACWACCADTASCVGPAAVTGTTTPPVAEAKHSEPATASVPDRTLSTGLKDCPDSPHPAPKGQSAPREQLTATMLPEGTACGVQQRSSNSQGPSQKQVNMLSVGGVTCMWLLMAVVAASTGARSAAASCPGVAHYTARTNLSADAAAGAHCSAQPPWPSLTVGCWGPTRADAAAAACLSSAVILQVGHTCDVEGTARGAGHTEQQHLESIIRTNRLDTHRRVVLQARDADSVERREDCDSSCGRH